MIDWKKAARTAQNFFPWAVEIKNTVYFYGRKWLRIAHESDFAAIAALPRASDDLFLDVGGNRGQSILSIRLFRPDARIISFEPNPLMFRQIQKRFAGDPRLTVHNFGLGSAAATLPLYLPFYRGFMYDGDATFSREAAVNYLSPKTLYFFDSSRLEIQEHVCEVKTLDSLGLAPSFIKVDVEGFEYEMLRGGIETLRRHQPAILIERYWPDPRVFELLHSLGYREVELEDGAFVERSTERANAMMMTPTRLRACRPASGTVGVSSATAPADRNEAHLGRV